MKPILMIGSTLVTLALISYSVGLLTEQLKKQFTKTALLFLTFGLVFDITATACMIIGSSNSPFTFHGFIGYSGLLAMVIETILAYRFYFNNPYGTKVSKGVHLYSRFAYILWVLVYITGVLLVILK